MENIHYTLPNLDSPSFLAVYSLLIRFHDSKSQPQEILHATQKSADDFGIADALLFSKGQQFQSRLVKIKPERIARVPDIAIVFTKEGQACLFKIIPDGLIIQTAAGEISRLDQATFLEQFSEYFFLTKSRASILGSMAKFDFSWFIPAVIRYRRELKQVLLMSLIIQLIALATPLFFQVITDKVLVHQATTTLNVLAIGLFTTIVFDTVLSWIRSYVFSHTSSRIDVRLGSQLFGHLSKLPSAYFAVRRVGDSVARVRELENIRNFLTNNSITLILDVLFSFVFIGVMLYYSPKLTLIALTSLPLYALISYLITPVLRNKLDDKFKKGAENQSFLVESLSGIDTIKSLSLEPAFHKSWDKKLAAYVQSSFNVTVLSSAAGACVNAISKLTSLAIMWVGASMVMDNQITIGQLIAFNMLSGQVANPIMRIANLWGEFQQVGISMERLGDILNTYPENNIGKTPINQMRGEIVLKDVQFKYKVDGKLILHGVNLHIPPNQTIGLVGRSGSGKSTLTKLIQGLYAPFAGAVIIDGLDIASVDPTSLRTRIGVVLQENYLFNRSIRDNIALAKPTASIEQVIAASQLAGAHEFIGALTEGYDTIIEERGVSLSGGQRQRIAIARALITNPKILIFDEATSALDYESEKIIQDNMAQISEGRTVIIIAHRLSAVRHADTIYVMDVGEVKESGSHEQLLAQDGLYAYLSRIQDGSGH